MGGFHWREDIGQGRHKIVGRRVRGSAIELRRKLIRERFHLNTIRRSQAVSHFRRAVAVQQGPLGRSAGRSCGEIIDGWRNDGII